jgi:hypothetical protein
LQSYVSRKKMTFVLKVVVWFTIQWTCVAGLDAEQPELRIPFVRGLNDKKGPMRRVEMARRGFKAAEFDRRVLRLKPTKRARRGV